MVTGDPVNLMKNSEHSNKKTFVCQVEASEIQGKRIKMFREQSHLAKNTRISPFAKDGRIKHAKAL